MSVIVSACTVVSSRVATVSASDDKAVTRRLPVLDMLLSDGYCAPDVDSADVTADISACDVCVANSLVTGADVNIDGLDETLGDLLVSASVVCADAFSLEISVCVTDDELAVCAEGVTPTDMVPDVSLKVVVPSDD